MNVKCGGSSIMLWKCFSSSALGKLILTDTLFDVTKDFALGWRFAMVTALNIKPEQQQNSPIQNLFMCQNCSVFTKFSLRGTESKGKPHFLNFTVYHIALLSVGVKHKCPEVCSCNRTKCGKVPCINVQNSIQFTYVQKVSQKFWTIPLKLLYKGKSFGKCNKTRWCNPHKLLCALF